MPLYSILHSYCKHFYSSWYTLSYWTRYQQFLTLLQSINGCERSPGERVLLACGESLLLYIIIIPVCVLFEGCLYLRPILQFRCQNFFAKMQQGRSGSFKSINKLIFYQKNRPTLDICCCQAARFSSIKWKFAQVSWLNFSYQVTLAPWDGVSQNSSIQFFNITNFF